MIELYLNDKTIPGFQEGFLKDESVSVILFVILKPNQCRNE